MTVRKQPALRAAVRKAKPDEDWVACYDENGVLVGICPPDAITPLANGTAVAPKPTAAAAGQPEEMAKAQQVTRLKKGLNAPRPAAENDRHAAAMGTAADTVLKHILSRRPTR